MKYSPLILWLCTALLAVGQEEVAPSSKINTMSTVDRAATAEANVRPALERDLAVLGLHYGAPVFLRAFKQERSLEVWLCQRETGRFLLFRSYSIAAASGGLGPKLAEGDGQVPEGFYYVPPAGMNPNSTFHLAFNIGYPNEYDRVLGRTGNFIMVHGSNVSIGCLAMTDAKIEEIYSLCAAALRDGQPFFRVHVFPFRMSEARMVAEKGNQHIKFWQNLYEGYQWFEDKHTLPEVIIENGRYTFK